ncbi:MAG: VCBS repeat-containing protein, partial [Planctomycetes bacterium]|nr:VCBS repeat-containing protein [Planctomycetota bacterium]
MHAQSQVRVLVRGAGFFRKLPSLEASTTRGARLNCRPARFVVPTLLVLMFSGCDPQAIRVGFEEAQTIIGEGIMTYETILSLQLPVSGAHVDILDLWSTNDPTVWAVFTREWSQDYETSATFLRVVDRNTGALVSSSPWLRSDLCGATWPVDIDGDDVFEGWCGGGGFSDVGLVGADGNTIWSFSGSFLDNEVDPASGLSAGDIDGDGDLEFCVGFSGSIGCFDEEGRTLWRVINGGWYDNVHIVSLGTTATRVLAVR